MFLLRRCVSASFSFSSASSSCASSIPFRRPKLFQSQNRSFRSSFAMATAVNKIGTHNGSFHCDEVLACFLLKLTDQYKDAEIVRTRDPAVLATLPIIVDVGGVYDPAKGRFDHHQREFTETFTPEHKIKLSSAGLIYKHFGHQIISKLVGVPESDPRVGLLHSKIYTGFIEALDGIDNGVNQYPETVEAKYSVTTDLSSRVGHLNPAWNEEADEKEIYQRFHKAMEMAGGEFVDRVKFFFKSVLPARDLVKTAIEQRMEVSPTGQLVLLKQFVSWKGHLFDLEEEMKIEPPILYVLYQDSNSSWRIQCVSEKASSFTNRKSLPEAWRGVRDEQLSQLTGIPGCIFVHASGFIGGNKTYEGVLRMAQLALEHQPPSVAASGADANMGTSEDQTAPVSKKRKTDKEID